MNIGEALEEIIRQGIEAVKQDYEENTDQYNGSIAGFEACQNKSPEELLSLLNKSREDTQKAFRRYPITEGYWFIRCFELEVEWVCNVLSAILMNNNYPVIIMPTYRGVMQAAKIIGIKER